MRYFLLPQAEWVRVQRVFVENGSQLPHESASIAVAEEDGEILGMVVLQFQLHAEPIWIREDARGKVSCKAMVGELDSALPKGTTYWAFAPDERVAQIAEACGGKRVDWSVLRKDT